MRVASTCRMRVAPSALPACKLQHGISVPVRAPVAAHRPAALPRTAIKAAASVGNAAPGKALRDLPNPLLSTQGLTLMRVNGTRALLREVVAGKVVLGVLRHLGCPLCWEQAKNLLALKPLFDAAGYKLVVVSHGTPQAGRQFCEAMPFPPQLLYLDAPDTRPLYKALALKSGWWTFFDRSTGHATMNALKKKDPLDFSNVVSKYQMIMPNTADSVTQMGGLFIFDGPRMLYAYEDPGVGAHAPNWEVLSVVCPSHPDAQPPATPATPAAVTPSMALVPSGPARSTAVAVRPAANNAVAVPAAMSSTAMMKVNRDVPMTVMTTAAKVVMPTAVVEPVTSDDIDQGFVINTELPDMGAVPVQLEREATPTAP